ncbi:MAG: serine hydrolase [Pseudoduganella sp.]|nr:serine hydrolase [Pseudoduganella sp.]
MHSLHALPALLLSILVSGCATTHRDHLASASVDETLKLLAERHNVCGVALAVIRNRSLESIRFASGCTPATTPGPDSIFQAASLSKPVFAYAVMRLAAQGKLDLDAPVMDYLPQGYRHRSNPLQAEPSELVTDARLRAVTARMVLNHTSGLPNWFSGRLSVHSTPGTKWNYSGEAYVLLQRAVETITKQTLDQFARSEVFKPLAMAHSDYTWNDEIARRLLPGAKANGAPRATFDLRTPVAAFSLYTSAADYGKFMAALLGDSAAIAQVTASPVTVDARLGLSWGLGWGIERAVDDSYIWQWGNNPGYRAFAIASVRSGDGFVMLTNSENGLELAKPLAEKILPGDHKLFHSTLLGWDPLNLICNAVRICL